MEENKRRIVRLSWVVDPAMNTNHDYRVDIYEGDKDATDDTGIIYFTYDEPTDRQAYESAVMDGETVKECEYRIVNSRIQEILEAYQRKVNHLMELKDLLEARRKEYNCD